MVDEERVRPIWDRLAGRSAVLGRALPDVEFVDDPAVHLLVGSREIQPLVTDLRCYRFSRIVWHDREGAQDVPIDHPCLGDGWWEVENAAGRPRRWTNGAAELRLPNAEIIDIHIAGTLSYRINAADPWRLAS